MIEDESLFLGRQYILVATVSLRDNPDVNNTLNYSFKAIDGEPPQEDSAIPDDDEEVETTPT